MREKTVETVTAFPHNVLISWLRRRTGNRATRVRVSARHTKIDVTYLNKIFTPDIQVHPAWPSDYSPAKFGSRLHVRELGVGQVWQGMLDKL